MLSKKKIVDEIAKSKKYVVAVDRAIQALNDLKPMYDDLRFMDDDINHKMELIRQLSSIRMQESVRLATLHEVAGIQYNGWWHEEK